MAQNTLYKTLQQMTDHKYTPMDTCKIEQLLNEKWDFTEGREDYKYYDHFKLGLDSYSANKHEDALEHFGKSLSIAQGLEDRTLLEFFAYYGLGYSYALTSRFRKTIDCFKKCLDLSKLWKKSGVSVDEKCFAAFAYIALGDGELFLGRSKTAIKFYEDALQLAAQMHDKERELIAYQKLGDVYKIDSQYAEALKHYKMCLEKTKEPPDNPTVLETRLRAQQGLGDVYKLTGQFDKAPKHYEECLNILSTFSDDEKKVKYQKSSIFAALGYLCGHTGQSTRAFEYYQMCLNLNLELHDKSIEFRAYEGLGYAYFLTGKCFHAITSFHKCLEIALETCDKHLETTSKLGLGDVYMLTGENVKANECYEQSIDIAKESKLRDIETSAYLGLGNACTVAGQCSKGFQYLEKCLQLSLAVGDRYHECQAYLGLGDVDIVEGKYEAAAANFKTGLNIAVEITERNCESKAKRSLADAHVLISSDEDTALHYQGALSIAEKIDNAYEKSRCHLGLGKVHKLTGNYEEALEHYEKAFSLAAGMSGRNVENDAVDMNADQIAIGLPFAHLIGNKRGALSGYWELGDLYNKLKNYQKALELFERYLAIAEETNDLIAQEGACERLVDIYKEQGRHYMAKQFQKKLQVIAEEREKANYGRYAMPNFACIGFYNPHGTYCSIRLFKFTYTLFYGCR